MANAATHEQPDDAFRFGREVSDTVHQCRVISGGTIALQHGLQRKPTESECRTVNELSSVHAVVPVAKLVKSFGRTIVPAESPDDFRYSANGNKIVVIKQAVDKSR